MKFYPLVVCISLLATLVFTGNIVFVKGASINWYAYGVSLVSIFITSNILSFIMALYYKTTLNTKEIKGFNFWGKSRIVKWENVSRVKPVNFLGLKYLRVFSTNTGLAIWVPLFIKNTEKFREVASNLPPMGNAFREYYSK